GRAARGLARGLELVGRGALGVLAVRLGLVGPGGGRRGRSRRGARAGGMSTRHGSEDGERPDELPHGRHSRMPDTRVARETRGELRSWQLAGRDRAATSRVPRVSPPLVVVLDIYRSATLVSSMASPSPS